MYKRCISNIASNQLNMSLQLSRFLLLYKYNLIPALKVRHDQNVIIFEISTTFGLSPQTLHSLPTSKIKRYLGIGAHHDVIER